MFILYDPIVPFGMRLGWLCDQAIQRFSDHAVTTTYISKQNVSK